jgi:hypothetical protein
MTASPNRKEAKSMPKRLIEVDEKVPLKLTAGERKLVLEDMICQDQDFEETIRATPAGEPVMMTLDDWIPPASEYDLVVVFRFLDRITVPRIVQDTLRPGGWLVYETFSASQCLREDNHISNPAFMLVPGELPALFPDFDVVADREDILPERTAQRFLGRRQPDE